MIKITEFRKKPLNPDPDTSSENYKIVIPDYKTTLVARKIDDEELYQSRKSNNLLSRINEEHYTEQDEVYIKTLESVEINKEGFKNIFRNELLDNTKYKEHSRGPVYGKDGHIVKHSVVGPSDIFEKMTKVKKTYKHDISHMSEKDSYIGDGTPNALKVNSSHLLPHHPHNARPQSTKSNLNLMDHQISMSFAESKFVPIGQRKREKNTNDIHIKKEDLLDHIDKMREAQDQFYREEYEKVNKLPTADRLFLTKDERIIENYEKKLNEWDRVTEVVNKKIGRKPDFSITTKGESFRRKKEQAAILDAVLPDHERYGKHYWTMTLRKPVAKLKMTKDGQEIPEDFETTLFRDKKEKLEILAKPRPFTRDTGRITTGKTEREYLSSRLSQREKIIEKMGPAKTDVIKEFMIEGCSKLTTEVDAFFKQGGRKEIFSVPKTFMEKKEKPSIVDEVIEKNYDRQEILRNGLTTIVKMK